MKILLPGLAKHLAKYSEGVYAEYEFHDMLTMLAELAPQLILDGHSVSIDNFVTWKQRINKGHLTKHPKTGEAIEVLPSCTIRSTISPRTQMDFKAAWRLKQLKNPSEEQVQEALKPFGHVKIVKRKNKPKLNRGQ